MKVVCVFLPAFIAVAIKKNREEKKELIETIFSYGLWVLLLNTLNMILVTFVLGMGGVTAEALDSFPFAIKYIVAASGMAFILPYVFEILKKYIQVNFKVETVDENKENN